MSLCIKYLSKSERANRAHSWQNERARQQMSGPRARGPALSQGLLIRVELDGLCRWVQWDKVVLGVHHASGWDFLNCGYGSVRLGGKSQK